MKTKIFLTGFRGSGKTTLAKLLAKKLNFELIEMDELIVKRAGKSIAEITKNGKEWYNFRLLESQVLKNILKKQKIVVATGGGLFTNDIEFKKGLSFGEYNYNLVNPVRDKKVKGKLKNKQISNGVKNLPEKLIIFLKVSEEVLKKRLLQPEFQDYNKNFRPSLTGDLKIDIEEEIKIYQKRLPLYETRADFIIETSEQKPEESLREILKLL